MSILYFERNKEILFIMGKTTIFNTYQKMCALFTNVKKYNPASLNNNSNWSQARYIW